MTLEYWMGFWSFESANKGWAVLFWFFLFFFILFSLILMSAGRDGICIWGDEVIPPNMLKESRLAQGVWGRKWAIMSLLFGLRTLIEFYWKALLEDSSMMVCQTGRVCANISCWILLNWHKSHCNLGQTWTSQWDLHLSPPPVTSLFLPASFLRGSFYLSNRIKSQSTKSHLRKVECMSLYVTMFIFFPI